MNTIQELREYIDELHIKINYDDYVNLITLVDEIDEKPYCKEDFRDWLIDNWAVVEENINKNITTILCSKQGDFNKDDEVDRENLAESIASEIKDEIINVIDTYEV